MKKSVALITLSFLLVHIALALFSPTALSSASGAQEENTAAANAVYACALSHDVYLYSSEDEDSGLFRIPYTYYVKIISTGLEYSYVQYSTDSTPYRAIYGYCKNDQLHFVDFIPARPFLYYTLEVTYRLEDYSDFFSQDEIFSSITVNCAYYGDYTVGSSTYCYVLLDGKAGYLPKNSEISYELNTDYVTPPPDAPIEEPADTATLPTERIALAVIVILLVVGVTYSLLHPRPSVAQAPVDEFEESKFP